MHSVLQASEYVTEYGGRTRLNPAATHGRQPAPLGPGRVRQRARKHARYAVPPEYQHPINKALLSRRQLSVNSVCNSRRRKVYAGQREARQPRRRFVWRAPSEVPHPTVPTDTPFTNAACYTTRHGVSPCSVDKPRKTPDYLLTCVRR